MSRCVISMKSVLTACLFEGGIILFYERNHNSQFLYLQSIYWFDLTKYLFSVEWAVKYEVLEAFE